MGKKIFFKVKTSKKNIIKKFKAILKVQDIFYSSNN